MARRINQNQFRKVYPGVRKRPQMITIGGLGVDIEIALLAFDGESSVTYNFTNQYESHPTVHASPGALGVDGGDVNLYISDISTEYVTISSSMAFNGVAHIVVVERS